MAIDNLISVEFTEQELTRLGNALNEIAQVGYQPYNRRKKTVRKHRR